VDNPLAGRRMLVVEDEMMVLLNIEDVLADLGCVSVTAAATSARALELIEEQVFDLAMLDINLDGKTSFAVAEALAACGVPFLFSTGYSDYDLGEAWRDRPVLEKPYTDLALAAIIERLLPAARPEPVMA